jgi:hypothetical protein
MRRQETVVQGRNMGSMADLPINCGYNITL